MKVNSLKSSLVIMILFMIMLLSYKYLYQRKGQELPKYGTYLSCVGQAFDVKVKLKSSVYLIEEIMPTDPIELADMLYSAAYYQNLFTFTNLADNNINSPLKWSTLTDQLPKIKIISNEAAPYPFHVSFDREEFAEDLKDGAFPNVPHAYLQRLNNLDKITKGMPARKVTYEYETDLYTCLTSNDPKIIEGLDLYQPMDPYLAYHLVPISQRKLVSNEIRFAKSMINPCYNPLGLTASRVNAFGYYYFWRPLAQGHSQDMVPFDCSLFYQENKTISKVSVEVTENVQKEIKFFDFKKFDGLNRPIRAAFLFGSQESRIFQKFDPLEAKKYIELYLSPIDTPTARAELPAFKNKFDANFSRLLLLIWNVSKHMDIIKKDIVTEELSLRITLKGKLKLSKKDLELRFSFSPNNPQYESANKFSESFSDEFLMNDIVIYEGHTAGGDVFSKGLQLLKEKNYSQQDKTIDYQIVALYSCSSSHFYQTNRFPKIDNSNFKRDVIRTAGDYLDSTGNGSLAVIASLDAYLYNESYVPFSYWAKNFKSDNFYILSND